jgi:tetratricopeptide (TPR) repeat protein
MKPFRTALAVFAISAASAFSAVRADELQDIGKLLRAGQHAQALERVNRYLAGRPKDAQGRFLKGLILAEQNRAGEAIEVFTRLSQDYPELPEPYNNVAVLYAAQGQYEKARQALETSIRTHPAYATAYENLGDVYTKLASQAYDKALQLDSSNTNAQSKLALMREITSAGQRSDARPAAAARAPEVSAPAPAKSAPAGSKASPSAPRAAAAAPAPASATEDVLKSVRAWAQAWSSKDVDAYLGFYAKDFKTPNGQPRAAWERLRRQRILAPKQIDVSIESARVTLTGADTATVTFRQTYRSDSIKASGVKTLSLVRVDGKWLIRHERIGS